MRVNCALLCSVVGFTMACEDSTGGLLAPDAALALTGRDLPAGRVGEAYDVTIRAASLSGASPYAWRVAQDSLHPGLTLVSEGPAARIVGVPTVAGTVAFSLRIADAAGAEATARFTLDVSASEDAPLRIVTERLPEGRVGAPYSGDIFAEGGRLPFTWAFPDGSPPGLIMANARGAFARLQGVPTEAGTFLVRVGVTDDLGASAERTFEVTIAARPGPRVVSQVLDGATTCTGYEAGLEATGGSGPPYAWQPVSPLPPGLRLVDGRLTGVPTAPGVYTVDVEVTDASGTTTAGTIRLEITDDPSIQRWVAFVGQLEGPLDEAYVVDVCDPSALPPPVRIAPGRAVQAAGGTPQARMSPDGRRLAFITPRQDTAPAALGVLDLSGPGSPPLELIPTGLGAERDVEDFGWSPDGGRLWLTGDFTEPNGSELYVVELSTPSQSTRVRLADASDDGAFGALAWSTDSRWVSFAVDGQLQAGAVGASGPDIVPLPNRRRSAWRPRAGGWLFTDDEGALRELRRLEDRFDTRVLLPANTLTETIDRIAAPPDGARIALAGEQGSVWIVGVTPAGAGSPVLLRAGGGDAISRLTWAPDSRGIAFKVDEPIDGGGNRNSALYLADAVDVSAPTRALTEALIATTGYRRPFTTSFAWSPTSDAVALVGQWATHPAGLEGPYVISLRGGPLAAAQVLSTIALTTTLRWSFDGRFLGIYAQQTGEAPAELFVTEPGGRAPHALAAGVISGGRLFAPRWGYLRGRDLLAFTDPSANQAVRLWRPSQSPTGTAVSLHPALPPGRQISRLVVLPRAY